MSVHIVTYDLHQVGQNYDCLYQKLKGYGTYWHAQGSVWLIDTKQSAAQVRDALTACLDENDKLFVAELSGEAAWLGYGPKVSAWIKNRLEPGVHV